MTDRKAEGVAESILDDIRSGVLKPGDYLPSARSLARGCRGVTMALATAGRTQKLVQASGLVEVDPGMGLKVRDPAALATVSTG